MQPEDLGHLPIDACKTCMHGSGLYIFVCVCVCLCACLGFSCAGVAQVEFADLGHRDYLYAADTCQAAGLRLPGYSRYEYQCVLRLLGTLQLESAFFTWTAKETPYLMVSSGNPKAQVVYDRLNQKASHIICVSN